MRGELNFQKYSRLLGEGLFADNIILSILDYRANRRLDPKSIGALRRAKKFFDDVIDGQRLQSSMISSAHDINAAKAYISVHPIRVRISQLHDYRDTIEGILSNSPVNRQKLDQLDSFFSSYSRIKFQKAKSVLETV